MGKTKKVLLWVLTIIAVLFFTEIMTSPGSRTTAPTKRVIPETVAAESDSIDYKSVLSKTESDMVESQPCDDVESSEASELSSTPTPGSKSERLSTQPPERTTAPTPDPSSNALPVIESAATELSEDSTFEVYFLDVGQADAAIIICDGESMLIDGGNAADSDQIYATLKSLNLNHLNYIVCTHAHEDHVGGLAGALNYATVDVAYCPVTECDSRAFESFVRYLQQQGKEITVPSSGDTFSLGQATAQVLGPIRPSDDPNNTSIVLRITYGDTSFLFTGDASREEEQDILNAG